MKRHPRGAVRSSARLSTGGGGGAAAAAAAAAAAVISEERAAARSAEAAAAAARRRARAAERAREVEDSPQELRDKCRQLARALQRAKHLVVYTGAGISTAADIPDYRGPRGVWTRLRRGETVGRVEVSRARPTLTHMALRALWARGTLKFVVSQNCDGLHVRSGLPRRALAELHGDMFAERCAACRRVYLRAFDTTERTARHAHATRRLCHACGAELADTIVHFGERGRAAWPLNWAGALRHAAAADVVLCLGSSLKVLRRYPRLWRMQRAPHARPQLYIVNLQWTPKDAGAALKINARCDDVMRLVARRLRLPVPRYRPRADPLLAHAVPLAPHEAHTTRRPLLSPPPPPERDSSTSSSPSCSSSPSPSSSDDEVPLRRLAERMRASPCSPDAPPPLQPALRNPISESLLYKPPLPPVPCKPPPEPCESPPAQRRPPPPPCEPPSTPWRCPSTPYEPTPLLRRPAPCEPPPEPCEPSPAPWRPPPAPKQPPPAPCELPPAPCEPPPSPRQPPASPRSPPPAPWQLPPAPCEPPPALKTPPSPPPPAPPPAPRSPPPRPLSLPKLPPPPDLLHAFQVSMVSGDATILLRAQHAPSVRPPPPPPPPRRPLSDLRLFRMCRRAAPPLAPPPPLAARLQQLLQAPARPPPPPPPPLPATNGHIKREPDDILENGYKFGSAVNTHSPSKRLFPNSGLTKHIETDSKVYDESKTKMEIDFDDDKKRPLIQVKCEVKDVKERAVVSECAGVGAGAGAVWERDAAEASVVAAAIIARAVLLCRPDLYPGLRTILRPQPSPAPTPTPAPAPSPAPAECGWCARHYRSRRCQWYGPPPADPLASRVWRRVRARRYLCACCPGEGAGEGEGEGGDEDGGGWYGKGYRKGRRRPRR